MAGILNKRSRFIDLVITQEGKRQIAAGKLRAEYASLSDSAVWYSTNEKNEEVRKRIYFESMESPNNVIVLEKDDSGKLVDFDFSPTGSIVGNNIFDKDATATNSLKLKPVTGSAFSKILFPTIIYFHQMRQDLICIRLSVLAENNLLH